MQGGPVYELLGVAVECAALDQLEVEVGCSGGSSLGVDACQILRPLIAAAPPLVCARQAITAFLGM
jgi:hypothetical protein